MTVPEPQTLALFALASLALIAVPGPSVLYIVTRSVSQGRRAGLVSVLGIEAGALVHVTAAALGVSALVASSATAFTVLKYAGAAYLVYLGVRKLRERPAELARSGETPRRSDRAARAGRAGATPASTATSAARASARCRIACTPRYTTYAAPTSFRTV